MIHDWMSNCLDGHATLTDSSLDPTLACPNKFKTEIHQLVMTYIGGALGWPYILYHEWSPSKHRMISTPSFKKMVFAVLVALRGRGLVQDIQLLVLKHYCKMVAQEMGVRTYRISMSELT